MNRKHMAIVAAIILLVVVFLGYTQLTVRPSVREPSYLEQVETPEGFEITTYATGLEGTSVSRPGPNTGPRLMLWKDDILYTTVTKAGEIVALPDGNKDGKADEKRIFMSGLKNPHGIEYRDGWFYIAEEHRVFRVKDRDNDLEADRDTLEVLVDGIPTGGHFTRTIRLRNDSMFISVGSSCNVCHEDNEWRAAITRCTLNGSGCRPYAEGLRNAVDFTFHPETGEMYATDNGRDHLGNDLPPDEINLVEEGKDYGWPLCYGKQVHDTEFDDNRTGEKPCEDTEPSLVNLQAHSAPLGLSFYTGNSFPEEYQDDLYVAYHGSWNRQPPTGYKVVRIDLDTGEVRDFAHGWLQGTNVLGRPVGISVRDGDMYVTDDNAGAIYRITYQG